MDKPRTPAGGDASKRPWEDDAVSEPSVGATGIFGTLTVPDEPGPDEPGPDELGPAEPVAAWAPMPPVPLAPLTPAAPWPASPPPAARPVPPQATLLPWETAPAVTPVPPPAPAPAPVPTPLPPAGSKPLVEPVVHKVVLGGGTEENSSELLDRIRMVTAERATSEKPAAAAPKGPGSGGFTELLRTLGTETPVPGTAAKPVAASSKPAPPAAVNSGFTSLLQTLNAPTQPKPVAATPIAVAPVAPAPLAPAPLAVAPFAVAPLAQAPLVPASFAPPAAPSGTPVPPPWQTVQAAPTPPAAPMPAPIPTSAPAPAMGGFTELLRISGPESPASPPAPYQPAPFQSAPFQPAPSASAAPPPAANGPGEFTRLFGTFSSTEAGAPPPAHLVPDSYAPESHQPEPYAGSSAPGSFTRMLSLEQIAEPQTPVYREEPPLRPGMDYGLTPNPAPAAPGNAPSAGNFSGRDPLGSFGSDVSGDAFWQEPAYQAPLSPAPPVASTPAGGVGITRLIQMLDAPVREQAAPAPPPPPPPAPGAPGVWTQTFASLAGTVPPPAQAAPPAWQPSAPAYPSPATAAPAAPSAGPSEFTRLIDASRAREMAMKGGVPAEPAAQAVPPPAFGSMPGFAPPPMPTMPQAPPMPGMQPPMPQPGGFAPPAMPAVPVPQPPAVQPPPAPAVGKLQQMVPLLLVIAIVLLVVVLVTVIFLLKK